MWERGRASGKATADASCSVWPDVQGALLNVLEDIAQLPAENTAKEEGKSKEKMSKLEEACRKGKTPGLQTTCVALARGETGHVLPLGAGIFLCRNRLKWMTLKVTFQLRYLHY